MPYIYICNVYYIYYNYNYIYNTLLDLLIYLVFETTEVQVSLPKVKSVAALVKMLTWDGLVSAYTFMKSSSLLG